MFTQEGTERFLAGAFGKIYSANLLEQLEMLRVESGAKRIDQTCPFDDPSTKKGDTVISVTLTLREAEENDALD